MGQDGGGGTDPQRLRERFRARFGRDATLYRAPGRVNLIGEHTDYNDGFVLPAAIDLATWVAAAPRDDRRVRIHAGNLDAAASFALDDPDPRPSRAWSDYPRGVALALERAGHRLRGADLLLHGEVPIGAGLSSSASLEVATAWALLDLAGMTPDRGEVARLCQRAENEFVGTRCGIMDQFASVHARAGHALLVDCRSLASRDVLLPPDVALLVCDSMVKHALAGGAYNRRRAECEEGVRILARVVPGLRALRDATASDVERQRGEMRDDVYRRCRHVVAENQRVLDAVAALEARDLRAAGALLCASHESLRRDFAVSCPELDLLVAEATALPGVFGTRMTGGGFGGCTITLVAARRAQDAAAALAERYRAAFGQTPWVRVCTASDGASHVA